MHFSIFIPNGITKAPVLWFLAGLTSNDQNFMQKAGAQKYAVQHGLVIITPDTSPRGLGIPGEDSNGWDFGVGAGMYVDAVEAPWSKGYKMFTYVTQELPALIAANFPQVDMERQAISGHSMGGHGALICALKNPGKYKSVSAFAPICNASEVPWGIKTFSAYLGSDKAIWKQYDACELAEKYSGPNPHILIHQGQKDKFLSNPDQLQTEKFSQICKKNTILSDTSITYCPAFDHGYYFIATFVEAHIEHHAKYLKA